MALSEFTKMLNEEIRKLCVKIHNDHPDISMDDMINIWCEQQGIDKSTFKLPNKSIIQRTGCQYIISRGQNSGKQCNQKTSNSNYCSKHNTKKDPEAEEEEDPEAEEEEDSEAEEEAEEEEDPEAEEEAEEEDPEAEEAEEDDEAEEEPAKKTCNHRFNKGPRAGDRCEQKPQSGQEFCTKHNKKTLTTSPPSTPKASASKASASKASASKASTSKASASKASTCEYVWTRGEKKGTRCESIPKQGTLCSKHKPKA